VHNEAERHHRDGRHVVLIGHEGHPEVIGTLGQLPEGTMTLVETVADAERVEVPTPERLAYTTQTTLSVDETAEIVEALKRRFPKIAGPRKEDICYATTNRQAAVKAIAPKAEAVLVIGAPNSSNSRRLVEVALAAGCAKAKLLQRASELDWSWLDGVGRLGISAGASAPELLVEELIDTLRTRRRVEIENVTVAEEDVSFRLPRQLVA
jgi:4-hydroxy-3-methylbut-2-enyl diphosphate reductase